MAAPVAFAARSGAASCGIRGRTNLDIRHLTFGIGARIARRICALFPLAPRLSFRTRCAQIPGIGARHLRGRISCVGVERPRDGGVFPADPDADPPLPS